MHSSCNHRKSINQENMLKFTDFLHFIDISPRFVKSVNSFKFSSVYKCRHFVVQGQDLVFISTNNVEQFFKGEMVNEELLLGVFIGILFHFFNLLKCLAKQVEDS